MKSSNKIVDKYYQQIFKLQEQAKMPERKKVERFEITLKLSIAHALIGQKYTKIIDVLDTAQEVKQQKSQISSKFLREAKTFQKSLETAGSLGRTWGRSGSAPQAGGSSSTEADSVAPAATSSLSRAPKRSGKPVNTTLSNSVNPNSKFILTNIKLVGWIEKWYNPEGYLQKLWDDKHTTFFQQRKCWGCRGSKHRGSNKCCSLTNRKAELNVTTAQAIEVSDSELEKA